VGCGKGVNPATRPVRSRALKHLASWRWSPISQTTRIGRPTLGRCFPRTPVARRVERMARRIGRSVGRRRPLHRNLRRGSARRLQLYLLSEEVWAITRPVLSAFIGSEQLTMTLPDQSPARIAECHLVSGLSRRSFRACRPSAPNPECQPACYSSPYSDLREAISIEKRYFTSDLSSLS